MQGTTDLLLLVLSSIVSSLNVFSPAALHQKGKRILAGVVIIDFRYILHFAIAFKVKVLLKRVSFST